MVRNVKLAKDRNDVSLKRVATIGLVAAVQNPALPTPRRLRALALIGALACALGGCSVSMPMASLIPAPHNDDDTTGSIASPQLSGLLDSDDWRFAKPAFNQALAEKTPETALWGNPNSGAKGSFIAEGNPFPGVSGLCRAFEAEVDRTSGDKSLEGTACAGTTGAWEVTSVKPTNKS
jgi:surface antigen